MNRQNIRLSVTLENLHTYYLSTYVYLLQDILYSKLYHHVRYLPKDILLVHLIPTQSNGASCICANKNETM